MKLGYNYIVTSGGYESKAVKINNGAWTKAVDDERSVWSKYSVYDHNVAITFVNDGWIVVVTHRLGGDRPDNNVATWVYIPNSIVITGQQIVEVINEILGLYNAGTAAVNEAAFTDNPILGRDYPQRKIVTKNVPSAGKKYAYRVVGDYTLAEILDNPFQDYYEPYKFVFVYSALPPVTLDLKNLSNNRIVEKIVALPPSAATIRDIFGASNVILTYNGAVFSEPQNCSSDTVFHLKAERPGFDPLDVTATPQKNGEELSLVVPTSQWRRPVKHSMFNVTDANTGKPITNFNINILNTEFDKKTGTLPESTKQITIKIQKQGYALFKETRSLEFNRPISIRLTPVAEQSEYTITTSDGRRMNITIEGRNANSSSPIDGYERENGRLVYKPSGGIGGGLKPVLIGAAIGILFTIIVYLLISIFSGDDNTEKTDTTGGITGPRKEKVQGGDNEDNIDQVEDLTDQQTKEKALADAVAYLDNNPVWDKLEMEKYPELKGLFDDLNQFNLERVTGYWAEKLKGSQKFQELVDHAITCLRYYYNPQKVITSNNPNGNYNEEGDLKINIQNYCNWINNGCTQKYYKSKASSTGGDGTAQHGKQNTGLPKVVSDVQQATQDSKKDNQETSSETVKKNRRGKVSQ